MKYDLDELNTALIVPVFVKPLEFILFIYY
jgi:hypothetical protein